MTYASLKGYPEPNTVLVTPLALRLFWTIPYKSLHCHDFRETRSQNSIRASEIGAIRCAWSQLKVDSTNAHGQITSVIGRWMHCFTVICYETLWTV